VESAIRSSLPEEVAEALLDDGSAALAWDTRAGAGEVFDLAVFGIGVASDFVTVSLAVSAVPSLVKRLRSRRSPDDEASVRVTGPDGLDLTIDLSESEDVIEQQLDDLKARITKR
jgi:hypothetical protein